MTRFFTVAALVAGALGAGLHAQAPTGAAAGPGQLQAPRQNRTVFASVLARDGTPVTDLTAADFEVKEGGRVWEITSVKLASTPLRLHTIVSDAGTGAFQLGVLRLVQILQSAEYAFTSVLVQPERLTDFTGSPQRVGDVIQRLGKRSALTSGNQLMEAIEGALKNIAAPGKRPVLLVLRIGNEATSTISASTVRDALRQTGTTMYVVSRSGASKAAPTTSAGASGTSSEIAQRQMNDANLADTALNLNLVLGDGSRDSGGYQQEISLLTAVTTLEQLAREIKNSYEITYVLPSGVKPSDRVQVTTKRKNVALRAPQRIAN